MLFKINIQLVQIFNVAVRVYNAYGIRMIKEEVSKKERENKNGD
jgi:hypothetical protein